MSELNYAFRQAVQWLYGQGIIKKDKDIADRTKRNKATVSSYITGRVVASKEFLSDFEKAFTLKLSDFEPGGDREVIRTPDVNQLLSENVLILKAEMQTNRQLLVELLAAVTKRPVTEVQLMAERFLERNVEKILHELRQEP